MKTLEFYDIEEFCDELDEKICRITEDRYVSVVAKYEDACEIIRELIFYDYRLKDVVLENPEFVGYDDEYEISIIDDEIYCEKMKSNCQYLISGASVVYFMEDTNSKAISAFPDVIEKYEVQIMDRDYNCEECDEICSDHCKCEVRKHNDTCSKDGVKIVKDDDGDMHGFTASKTDNNGYSSYSFYTSEKITDDVMDRLISLFEEF